MNHTNIPRANPAYNQMSLRKSRASIMYSLWILC